MHSLPPPPTHTHTHTHAHTHTHTRARVHAVHTFTLPLFLSISISFFLFLSLLSFPSVPHASWLQGLAVVLSSCGSVSLHAHDTSDHDSAAKCLLSRRPLHPCIVTAVPPDACRLVLLESCLHAHDNAVRHVLSRGPIHPVAANVHPGPWLSKFGLLTTALPANVCCG